MYIFKIKRDIKIIGAKAILSFLFFILNIISIKEIIPPILKLKNINIIVVFNSKKKPKKINNLISPPPIIFLLYIYIGRKIIKINKSDSILLYKAYSFSIKNLKNKQIINPNFIICLSIVLCLKSIIAINKVIISKSIFIINLFFLKLSSPNSSKYKPIY
jgi:hypothetical protein